MIDKPSLSIEDYEICNKLKSMRFSGMAEALEEVLADPNAELFPFREKIQRIVDAEWNLRYTKKLNRCMIDEKIPSEYRDSIPLIACGKEILWMVGSRINERYKINPQTRKVLVLNYQGGNENE